MTARLFALTALLFLSACAYALDWQQQQITFNSVGAKHASCDVWLNGIRYRVYPPQTITVNRSQKDLIVDCMAPGRRHKKIVIPAAINDTTMLNVANGGVGLPLDYLSQSMYAYPDRIEIDFTGMSARKQEAPNHNDPDLIQPEEYLLEEYSPSTPRLNSDLTEPSYSALPRRTSDQSEGGYDSFEDSSAEPSYADKGDLMPVGTSVSTPAPAAQTQGSAPGNFGPVLPNAMVNPGAAPQTVPSYPGE